MAARDAVGAAPIAHGHDEDFASSS